MEVVFIIFMTIASLVLVFSCLVILRDIIHEIKLEREEKKKENGEEVKVNQIEVKEVPTEEIKESSNENNPTFDVAFNKVHSQTLDEKYKTLSKKEKSWYDEIVRYASSFENSRQFKNARYEEYKIGARSLVRIVIKRGIINCEFTILNIDFKNYVDENKIHVKQAPTIIKIENEEGIAVTKNSIDIAYNAIKAEKEYKKRVALEKKRAQKVTQ